MEPLLVKEAIVPQECHGLRADVMLAQLFPEFSRSQLSLWLKQGVITVNQRQCKPKDKVFGGESIALTLAQDNLTHHEDLAESIPIDIVFEDEHLLIVNKPVGLVVHPGAGNREHTLVNALLNHDASLHQLPRAGIVHRLDKDTSGLLIIAKTFATHTAMIRQMQAREIQRCYLALVYGHIISGGRIDTFYGRHPRNRLKMAVCKQGKDAVTEYVVRKQYQSVTLLDVKLLTGRTHQIRVHMESINHPLIGDQLYGGRARLPAGLTPTLRETLQQFKRQALHAYSLSFVHPVSHELLTFTAPVPDDFQSLLTALDETCD